MIVPPPAVRATFTPLPAFTKLSVLALPEVCSVRVPPPATMVLTPAEALMKSPPPPAIRLLFPVPDTMVTAPEPAWMVSLDVSPVIESLPAALPITL